MSIRKGAYGRVARRDRQVRKGQTGNAGGRPKGLAATVREATDLDALLRVLLGIVADTACRAADRIRAAELVLDRGWGKAPAYAPIADGDPLEECEIDRAIRAIADQLRQTSTHAEQN